MKRIKVVIIFVITFLFLGKVMTVHAEDDIAISPESNEAQLDDMEEGMPEEEISADIMPQASGLSLSVNYPSQIMCGEPVTFTMNADGGSGNYKYRIHTLSTYQDSELVQVYDVSYGSNSAYSESNEFTFTFYASGSYIMRFSVMDMGSKPYQTVTTGLYEHQINIQDSRYPSVDQIVNEVAAQCVSECTTDFEKALWLHDWILDHADYDYSYTYTSAEGVLARGAGTCESYHRAYVLLLNKVGIQTGRITGNGHVWTAVKIDDAWYQVDSTWDDMGAQYKGTYNEHLYFGLTDYIIGLVHTDHTSAAAGYESTALENNYFIKTGEIKQWSETFAEPIMKNIADGKIEFTLSVTDSMPDSYKNIIYNLVAYQLSKQSWNGTGISVSYKDAVLRVRTDVAGELHSLSVTPPKKILYKKDEKPDTTGLTVVANYTEGSRILTEKEYVIQGFETNTVGKHTAVIMYEGKSAAFQYTVEEEKKTVGISYRTHVQDIGWQSWKANGGMSGTSGRAKRLEGIEIKLSTAAKLGIQYTTHCQDYGWLPWSSDGGMSGTTGEAKRLEAIKIQLTGADKSNYDVYYRVHAESYGWMGWVKNGAAAGTSGYGKRLEGIQIVIVTKGGSFDRNMKGISSRTSKGFIAKTGREPSVGGAGTSNTMYRTHVQDIGWQGWKYNGQMSGTSGRAKRLEGIELRLSNQQYSGGIQYRTHIQDIGWQGWKANGAMSGTSGRAKRLEAIQIKLTGSMAQKYDVYYRVHAQNFGWMGWAKNGQSAGTAGYGYRLEGIEIRLVAKGAKAPGSTANAFRNRK